MFVKENSYIEECDNIDTDFPEIKKIKYDNVTFSDCVSVYKLSEKWKRREAKTLWDSEENGET